MIFFFFKQKTAYEMRISDWSSDVCSSDLVAQGLNFVSVTNRIGASGATACKQAAASGMGWRVAQDCDLGLTPAHGGGYPGSGLHVTLTPDHCPGLLALAHPTYSRSSTPPWDTAVARGKAGLPKVRASPGLAAGEEAYA